MAAKYKEGSLTKSAITAITNDTAINVLGYSDISVQVKFATCTGTANTAPHLDLETSNDGSNWTSIKVLHSAGADCVDFNADNVQLHIPDYATAGDGGFGKYIRFTFTGYGTFSVSYTVTYLLKG